MDIVSKKQRSENMSRIRGKNTKPEMVLRSLLHRAGFRFRIHVKKLPGTPDIVLTKYKTVIQVHGCFWHHHEGCSETTTPKTHQSFWKEKFARTVERDSEQKAELELLGWNVLIVWECELKKNPDKVLQIIRGELLGG